MTLVSVLAGSGVAFPEAAAGQSPGAVLEQELLTQLNHERAARGLAAFRADGALINASRAWSANMASSNQFRHSSDGRAEIIAKGWWSGHITEAWMKSDGHRNLIVDPNLGSAGVGVVCGADGQVWATVQFFRIDRSLGTLTSSAPTPTVTDPNSGNGCDLDHEVSQVRRLYQAYFRRESDDAGLAHWVSRLLNGGSLIEVSNAFAGSPEFVHRYGHLSDRAFIERVYLNVLGRRPDPSGYDYWLRSLRRGTTRGELMIGFSESSEFRRVTGIG